MSPFLANLPHIEKVVAQTCRRCRFRKEEAEDFSSLVMIKLMENDYAVLRKFQEKCDLTVYLTVCIKRMMLDHQNHLWGKWRSSTEASRLGEVAVRLENLLRRDGFSFREAQGGRGDPSDQRQGRIRAGARRPRGPPASQDSSPTHGGRYRAPQPAGPGQPRRGVLQRERVESILTHYQRKS